MDENDFEVLVQVPEGKFFGLPYYSKSLERYVFDVNWNEYGQQRWTESLDLMLDCYDDLFDKINTPTILRLLSPQTYNYISNELRVGVFVEAEKEPLLASFIEFPARRDPLKRIGIIIGCKHPSKRTCYRWEVEEFGIASVGHIDFERIKEYKPKDTESHREYMHRLFKHTRGNVGELAASDNYRILIRKSADIDGWRHDFLRARIIYKDLIIQQKEMELAKYQNQIFVFS